MSRALTPADIRNPKRKSGYDYVQVTWRAAKADPNHSAAHPYRARLGGGHPERKAYWQGPRRRTALEAAWDYCKHMSGAGVTRATYSDPSVDMGGVKRHAPQASPEKFDRKAHRGSHDLYDVEIYDAVTGIVYRRKVGITAVGLNRYEGFCKTFGFSVRPVCKARTFKTYEAARKAEDRKIAKLQRDPAHRQVGREAFAPR